MTRHIPSRFAFLACALLVALPGRLEAHDPIETDVCVYGGSAGGVAAALAAARRGLDVVIVEPMRHLGGMHGGGIRLQRDCLYSKDIGGLAKELHDDDLHMPGDGQFANQWPGRLMLRRKVEAAGIQYFTQYRLDTRDDVVKRGDRIESIHLNYAPLLEEGVPPEQPVKRNALSIRAKVFIDASYEGDLMAFAGCEYVVGRESKDHYGESLAGQGRLRVFDVDPYAVPGDPTSGLLPMISTEPYEPSAGSRHIIAYNFRMNGLRDDVEHDGKGSPVQPLGLDVDRQRYALVMRALGSKDGRRLIGWPEWNYGRTTMVSGGLPGRQADYPDGDWKTRSEIWREWIDHVKSLNILCGLKNPVVFKGEYPDNHDFPDQLYIRMGRRMVGEYVITQHDLMHQTTVNDSIGLAYYYVDIYPTRLIAHEGRVASEGEMFIRACPGPFPISYRAIIPKKGQCDNLLVPVCMSASHVAMAAIRMESGYVVMGEAAGIAASHACKSSQTVQDIDFEMLRSDLDRAGIVTHWNGEGYGPNPKGQPEVHWLTHPEDYQKIPIRLDKSWKDYSPSSLAEAFASREEWNARKPGFEWLFPFIDKNSDGTIDLGEHQQFQDYKKRHPDWADTLKAERLR